jgi:hypothetical protein
MNSLFEFEHDDRLTPTQSLDQRVDGQMTELKWANPTLHTRLAGFLAAYREAGDSEGIVRVLGQAEKAVSAALKPQSKVAKHKKKPVVRKK